MTEITTRPWGVAEDGAPLQLFTLHNAKGTEVEISNLGGHIVTVRTADRAGKFGDVVLGFDNALSYQQKNPYFGATVGRFANRIKNGQFSLDNVNYQLARNNGNNALHGGIKGFDKAVWQSKLVAVNDGQGLQLTYVSKDGEENFPGALTVVLTYTLTGGDGLEIDYKATADKSTILNLTNHSYFDLSGDFSGNILSHEISILADNFVPTDAESIPLGEIRSVTGTPFDLRQRTAIGQNIDSDDEQIRYGWGYDHTFVINGTPGETRLAARVWEPKSGRTLDVLTTQPGVQFYTGNHLNGTSATGKYGKVYGKRSAFCLETQHYPDSPNQPSFPSTRLNPGEEFHQKTIFRFSVEG